MRLRHDRRSVLARALLAAAAVAALATAVPARLGAQGTLSIPIGNPIRVRSAPFTGAGYAAWATSDTLTMIVSRQPEPIRLPLASVTSLEARIQNTPRRSALRRGVMGFLAGTAVWGLSHVFVDYEAVYPYQKGYTSLTRGGAFALYAGTGAGLGAVWGALRPGSRWERAQPPVRVHVFEP
jgi:hypothetical protein